MARSMLTDVLLNSHFYILDVFPIQAFALPILTPLFGFSEITAPEMTANTEEIQEGNWYFPHKVIKNASVGNITLKRGVTFYDGDFWRWAMTAVTGDMSNSKFGVGPVSLPVGGITPRRTLMLVQFMRGPTIGSNQPLGLAALAEETGLQAAGGFFAGANFGQIASASAVTAGLTGLVAGAGALGAELPFEFIARVPAKAWMLVGAIPVRYKVGSDFDASASAVSIQEIELAVDYFEEVSLSS